MQQRRKEEIFESWVNGNLSETKEIIRKLTKSELVDLVCFAYFNECAGFVSFIKNSIIGVK